MSQDLEQALSQTLAGIEAPSADVTDRVRAAALASLPSATAERPLQPSAWARLRRRPSARGWRRLGPLALAVALIVGGGALAGVLSTHASPDRRTGDFASASAQTAFEANPALADSPWLNGGLGFTFIQVAVTRPSLVFPRGVGYARALQSFYDAVSRRGQLPAGTRLGPPLPRGVVVSLPGGAARGVAIDLRAPFGYSVPNGRILQPIYVITRSTIFPDHPAEIGTRLPIGARVITPHLEACQVARGAVHRACPLAVPGPEAARPGSGTITVPDLEGLPVGVAIRHAHAAGLALMPGSWLQAWSAGALARARRAGHAPLTLCRQNAHGRPPSSNDFRDHGPQALNAIECYPAAELLPGDRSALGAVVAQVPTAGSSVSWGSTVALLVAADDCLRAGIPDWCVPGAEATRHRNPVLARPPWLRNPGEEPDVRRIGTMPSLVFPLGTSYTRAVRALVSAVVQQGTLPPTARLGPPLPRGIVLGRAADGHLVLSLAAPFGYDPQTGTVLGFQRLLDSDRTPPYADAIARARRSGRVMSMPFVLAVKEGSRYLARPTPAPCQVMASGAKPVPCAVLR